MLGVDPVGLKSPGRVWHPASEIGTLSIGAATVAVKMGPKMAPKIGKSYPLVNIQKAIENSDLVRGFSHEKWWIFP